MVYEFDYVVELVKSSFTISFIGAEYINFSSFSPSVRSLFSKEIEGDIEGTCFCGKVAPFYSF